MRFIKRYNKYKLTYSDNLNNLNEEAIYAYRTSDGGIYKSHEISVQKGKNITIKNNNIATFYTFIRLDNRMGYYQKPYDTIKELLIDHLTGNHLGSSIYVFENTKDFLNWCLTDKIY